MPPSVTGTGRRRNGRRGRRIGAGDGRGGGADLGAEGGGEREGGVGERFVGAPSYFWAAASVVVTVTVTHTLLLSSDPRGQAGGCA